VRNEPALSTRARLQGRGFVLFCAVELLLLLLLLRPRERNLEHGT